MHFRRHVFCNAALAAALAACLVSSGCGSPPKTGQGAFALRPGDLLFQDLDGSPFCDAVEKVTQGYRGAALTHVGMVARNAGGEVVVLEAVQEGVTPTPLDLFLDRSRDANGNPKVLVGRLKRRYRPLIQPAIVEAFALNGKPYDQVFDIRNDAYYCSELVYVCFRNANGGSPIFELRPMTFVDPDTQETFPVWKTYFEELKIPIPEGNPGLNPGGLSRSPVLRIVHTYGVPAGWRETR